jgi:hypothetical protein
VEEDFYSVDEAARILKLTPGRIRQMLRAGTRYGEDGMHIVRAGEFRRAVRWKLEIGSKECEFVSLVSLINPSAGNIWEEENPEEPEIDSTNSQTHTRGKERAGL